MDVNLIISSMYNIFIIASRAIVYISIASLLILLGIALILTVAVGIDLIIEFIYKYGFISRMIMQKKNKKNKRQILNEGKK